MFTADPVDHFSIWSKQVSWTLANDIAGLVEGLHKKKRWIGCGNEHLRFQIGLCPTDIRTSPMGLSVSCTKETFEMFQKILQISLG